MNEIRILIVDDDHSLLEALPEAIRLRMNGLEIDTSDTAAAALEQLSLRYGHNRYARTGILDAFIERYRDGGEARGIPFLEWVEHHYDAAALAREFKPLPFADFIMTRVMRRD